MSHRSRRFLAAREATTLPTALNHHDAPSAVAPSLQKMLDGASDNKLSRMQKGSAHEEAAKEVEKHGPGFLATAAEQITSLTGKLVAWGKDHPVRTAAAAAVLIAASGLLVQVMRRKTPRVAAVRRGAKQINKRVKSGIRKAMKKVGSAVRSGGLKSSKPRLALARVSKLGRKNRR